jgi:hypothetical protein
MMLESKIKKSAENILLMIGDAPVKGHLNTIISLANEQLLLCEEINRLRSALMFYANCSDYVAPLTGGMGKLWNDCGQTARAALEGK